MIVDVYHNIYVAIGIQNHNDFFSVAERYVGVAPGYDSEQKGRGRQRARDHRETRRRRVMELQPLSDGVICVLLVVLS